MNEQQSFMIIKQALDVAAAKGVFENLQAAATVFHALNILQPKKQVDNGTRPTDQQQ